MGMIQQLERLEQRAPDGIRSAVWSGLRLPHLVVRGRVIADYLASHSVRKLQIGCGGNILSGWLNSDLNPVRSIGVFLASREESHGREQLVANGVGTPHPLRDIIFIDATKALPFPDGVFDYVFSEHMIEHIDYRSAMGLIKEAYRTLKPGGRLRLSTPDLGFLMDLYGQDKTEVQKRYLAWATSSFLPSVEFQDLQADADTFVINNFVRNWGHQFIYDQKTLSSSLERCGFRDITRYQPGESEDENLRGIESHGRRITDDFNRLESIVLEAAKPA